MESKDAREDTIYLNSTINEIFATTEVTQYFTNPLDNAIELSVSFPIKEEINLSKFVITTGDKIVLSKVMPKEKAEEKYNDVISSGNQGFISNYNESMTGYTVNIGNINPKQKLKLNAVFIQMISSQDMSYSFDMMEKYPSFHYKELIHKGPDNKIINANFTIETQSKITRLIAPFLGKEEEKNSIYTTVFSNDYKKAVIKYSKNSDNQKSDNENLNSIIYNRYSGQENKYESFCLLFRTENMNNPILYYQYNPILKEMSYSINYVYPSKTLKNIPIPSKPDQDNTISYCSKYEDNTLNNTPGFFIFLIDQSGSMGGEPIELVKQALLLFFQSLPAGSYFQLIGFGSDYTKYNEKPVEYNQENVNNIIQVINNLDAGMGGTNISSPLEDIYKDSNNYYSNINLSRNIFLLTDGDVDNREECINLITTNSNKFRIHALGIGRNFDKVLIERSGKLGKGSSTFVQDVNNINSAVIDTLNKCLRPYITDIQFNFINYQNNNNNAIIRCNPVNNFTYQNEIMNYSFILDDKNKIDIENLSQPINIEIYGKDPKNIIKEKVSFMGGQNIIKIENGEEMGKMIVGKALKNNKELINDEKKEIEFAKKYQILSKNTSLFAEIINDGNNPQTKLIKVNLNDKKYENTMNIMSSSISSNYFLNYNMNNNINYNFNNNYNNIFHNNYNNMNNMNYNNNINNNYNSMNNMNYNNNNNNNYNSKNNMNYNNNNNNNSKNNMNYNNNINNNYKNYNSNNGFINNNNCNNNSIKNLYVNCSNSNMNNFINCNPNLMNSFNQLNKNNTMKDNFMKLNSSGAGSLNLKRKSYFNNCCNDYDYTEGGDDIYNANKANNIFKDDITRIIMSQNIIEGFWSENNETRKIINIIGKTIFDKICNNVKELYLNRDQLEKNIIYTILVIYYLENKHSDKLNEYKLIINKAKQFLLNQKINYEEFIKYI